MKDNILIVEDDAVIAELEKNYLSANGYDVDVCNEGVSGLKAALDKDYSLIVLDVMLPGMSGLEICKELRRTKNTPVLFVTAKQGDDDLVTGFDMGCDDYITKPFNFKEFVVRVNAHVNRFKKLTGSEASDMLEIGCIRLCRSARRVYLDSVEIQMTNKEFDLLLFLAMNPNRVFSKDELFMKIWGYDSIGETSTVTVHINRIREKIDNNSLGAQYIETVWGAGYRFKD